MQLPTLHSSQSLASQVAVTRVSASIGNAGAEETSEQEHSVEARFAELVATEDLNQARSSQQTNMTQETDRRNSHDHHKERGAYNSAERYLCIISAAAAQRGVPIT